MKKYITIFLTSLSLMTLASSCIDSWLDIQNENGLSTGNFWKTEDDMQAGLNAVYAMFYRQGTWTRNLMNQLDGMADDGVLYSSWTELNEWTKFIYTDYNFAEVNTKIWKEHWTAINRANQVLDHIDDPAVTFEDENVRKDIKAQALWFRSWYYFYMTVLWDNIPIILKTSSASDTPQNATADEVFSQIEGDLLKAIPDLPLSRDEEKAKPTKGAAYGLLARVYAQHHKWKEALDCLDWIIYGKEGKQLYDLEMNFGDNFNNHKENNIESLYEIQFSLCNDVGWDATDNYLGSDAQLGTQIEISRSPKGMGWQIVESNPWVKDYFKREKTIEGRNDPRMYYTLWYRDAEKDFPEFENHLIYGKTWEQLGYSGSDNDRVYIKKYSTDVSPVYYWNDNNFRAIRLSDMLLLYAECSNEYNQGPDSKAIECLDRVRNRAGLPDIKDSKFYDGTLITSDYDAFKEHIKIERGLELAFEGMRWIDLKRWGFDESSLEEIAQRDADFNNFVIGKHERLPIPQTDVDNNPNLNQNPNY